MSRFVPHSRHPGDVVIGYAQDRDPETLVCTAHGPGPCRDMIALKALPHGVSCQVCGAVHMRTLVGEYGWLYPDNLLMMARALAEDDDG